MESGRAIDVAIGGSESATTTFARDQLLLLDCARDGRAKARVWRRSEAGLLLGRFHRASTASIAWADSALSRRLSGGRIVPAGPGVVCITLVAPLVDWLDPAGRALKPEQVLNRALRPLLSVLRSERIEAFYPGRDLVTCGGRALAHASFTVMRDGVAVVEMHVAESRAFAVLPELLDKLDPQGVAGVDRAALDASTSLVEAGLAPRTDEEWAERYLSAATSTFACEGRISRVAFSSDGAAGDENVTAAHASAARDFLAEPGPMDDGLRSAAAVSMLGVVECCGRLHGDRLTGLRITGDLIAPFHTLDEVASQCEGEPLRPANIRKALARVMAGPRNFLLGLRELDELILRLA